MVLDDHGSVLPTPTVGALGYNASDLKEVGIPSGPIEPLHTSEVSDGCLKFRDAVMERPQAGIMGNAEDSPKLPSFMIMVGNQLVLSATDTATTGSGSLPLLKGDSILAL